MDVVSVQERYDQFQEPAVSNILSDFTKKPCGRFLLVIPSGGGKTFTAVKAINRLFEAGVLRPDQDRVLWTAHRKELITQAIDTFNRFSDLYPERQNFDNKVDFKMISGADGFLAANSNIRLVVLDEAHHAALKNVSYGPIFLYKNVGILGLTATPSRHDGEPLDFERESFSIGFPDLVKKQLILKPEIRKVQGGTFQITSIDDDESLEQLNNKERNNNIIAELLNHAEEYKKVIIYVGTINHVKSLYDQLLKSPLKGKYDSISFITGSENSRNQDRDQFVEQEKKHNRSIMVNVMVLSEGYDDPSINTVVMATPSHSKLYYMQAMGRAIRHDPNDSLKKAFCVEIEDTLPNIRYRIDNRWLYSDVSDALEPAVIDEEYGTAKDFAGVFTALYDRYNVPAGHRKIPAYDRDQRYTMLLFKRYLSPGNYVHFPLVVTNGNRLQVSNMFNFLSERMKDFKKKGIVGEAAFRMVGGSTFTALGEEDERRWVYDAMRNAVPGIPLEQQQKFVIEGYPWITFIALHYRQPELPEEILDFTKEMINRDDVLEQIKSRNFEGGAHLVRLPLPLKSYVGKIVSTPELTAIEEIVQKLRKIRNEKGSCDHRTDVHTLIAGSIFPIELAFKDSLILIGRNDDPFSLPLR